MDTRDYKRRVVNLFCNGQPTLAQWEEMAAAVLFASEGCDTDLHPTEIDKSIMTPEEYAEYGPVERGDA